MVEPYILSFEPTFKSRIWGGDRLSKWFPQCPTSDKIGEAWVLSDHPEGPSPIANGPYQGKTLQEVMALEPTWFQAVASHQIPDNRFPLLVKVIDAADDLSVQVHPDDAYGYAHAGEQGKTECWWVLDAASESQLIYGHTAQSADNFRALVEAGAWSELLTTVTPHAGDFFFVPSGKVHALGKGTMVLEIQQSSDTTYRVYDYNRIDANGTSRALHLDSAIAVTSFPDQSVPDQRKPLSRGELVAEELVECPYFRVERWSTTIPSTPLQTDTLTVLSILSGEGSIASGPHTVSVQPGSQVLLPDGLESITLHGTLTLLATTLPQRDVN